MNRDTLQALATEFAADYSLPAEDWEAIVAQAERLLAAVAKLDELPLPSVEPAAVYSCDAQQGGLS
jgi:hypothetical protein